MSGGAGRSEGGQEGCEEDKGGVREARRDVRMVREV